MEFIIRENFIILLSHITYFSVLLYSDNILYDISCHS